MRKTFCCGFSLGAYDIAEAEGVQRGTKIVVHLRGDCYNYAKEEIIKGKKNVHIWHNTELSCFDKKLPDEKS